MSLLENTKLSILHRGDTAAAAADVDSTTRVDMKGYEGCLFLCAVTETTVSSTSVARLQVRHADNSTATLTDVGDYAGAVFTTANWGKALAVDIYRPLKRYLSISVNKPGADATQVSSVFALQYGGKQGPISQSATFVEDSEILISPTT